MSNEALQTPQVASTDDAAGAIQIAGTVMMYDNGRLEQNRTLLQIAVEQHTAVSDLNVMLLCRCSRCMYERYVCGCNIIGSLLCRNSLNCMGKHSKLDSNSEQE